MKGFGFKGKTEFPHPVLTSDSFSDLIMFLCIDFILGLTEKSN